jgi:iron complex transport system substrate-binding protein
MHLFHYRRAGSRYLLALCLALLPLCLPAAIRVVDDLGQSVELARPARRIVSLAPHITELLFDAGAGAAVVGVSEFSDFPAPARDLPRVGGGGGIDLEAVVALHPDLVIAWASGNPAAQVQRLRALGLAVFHSEPRTLADIPRTLQRFGRLAGTEAAAQRAATAYDRRLHRLRERYAWRRPVRVFYQAWDRPLMTVNGAHIISDVLALCGGVNIFADQPGLAPQVSTEAVLVRDPQVILIGTGDDDAGPLTARWQRWPRMQAVRDGHVLAVQRDLLVRMTPRLLDGAGEVCELLDRVRGVRP